MPEPFCTAEPGTDTERAFVRTVKESDAKSLRKLLGEHPELEPRIDEPWFDFDAPAMVWVGSHFDREKALTLLEHGADIDASSRWAAGSYSALQHCVDCATEESLEFAQFLIERGATIDFHSAAGLGRIDLLKAELQRNPDKVNERGPDGATALHLASTVEVADLLLEAGADPAARCVDHDSTAAMWLLKAYPEISRHLAAKGSPVDIFMAAALGDTELIDRCLTEQPDAITARIAATDGWTRFTGGGDKYIWALGLYRSPHKLAQEFGHENAYRQLLEKSPVAIRLAAACECNDRAAAEGIIAEDPDAVRKLPPEHGRLLADAAWVGELDAVRLMLDLGFDPHVPGDHDSIPLDRAAFHGYRDIVELLLERDPEPPLTRKNEFGGTPLGACLYGRIHGWIQDTDYPGTVRALLGAGATISRDWLPHPNAEVNAVLQEYPGNVEG